MDIRKFFSPPKDKKSKSSSGNGRDDFVPKKVKKKNKGVIYDSSDDSSDENPLPKKTRASIDSKDIILASDDETSYKKPKKAGEQRPTNGKGGKVNKKDKLKEITPDGFFGASKQTVRKQHRINKRKASDDSQVITIDDDLDFDDSLKMTPKKKVKHDKKANLDDRTTSKRSYKGSTEISPKSKVEPKMHRASNSGNSKATKVSSVKGAANNQKDGSAVDNVAKSSVRTKKISPIEDTKSYKRIDTHVTTPKDEAASSLKHIKESKITASSTKAKAVDNIGESSGNTPSKNANHPAKSRKTSEDSVEGSEASSKQSRYMKYMQWQSRPGAKAPGSKEIPEGKDNCLEGMTFVITGILESLERDQAKTLVERYGGKVTGSISGRTSYIVVGDDPGESKIKKAEQHKTKRLDEDGLLELIKNAPGKKSKYDVAVEKLLKEEAEKREKSLPSKNKTTKKTRPDDVTVEKLLEEESQKREMSLPSKNTNAKKTRTDGGDLTSTTSSFYGSGKSKDTPTQSVLRSAGDSQGSSSSLSDSQKAFANSQPDAEYLLWVDKYKPKTLKQIIGQQGAKSNVEKLRKWMLDWHLNNRPKDGSKPKPKPKVNPWGGGGDPTGAGFKAALLSGPPGVGKTTAATLVCKELGFEYVEYNASDTRSKKALQDVMSQMTDNTSITNMFGSKEMQLTAASGTKNALIMDEIDGMAGNEDRGGMQEVIQLIKTTKIPIICMCNDRTSSKMRSLTNHCFDLRFQRPRVEQITGAMMSICYKEGLKIPAPALQALIRGSNQDIRQILYNLSMLRASNTSVSYDEAQKHADGAQKDVSLGIFDIARKLLTSESAALSMNDKLSLFFMDYSIIPLFVQDNYPLIRPSTAGGNVCKHLDALSQTADSIAMGDQLDKLLRSDQAWGALPTVGLLSTVIPCDIMRGGMSGMINFPSFFGRLSTMGKNRRLLQELKFHSCIPTNGANEEMFNADYLPFLRWHLTQPLIAQSKTGESEVQKTSALMDAYDLLREDFDSILELGQYPGKPQPMAMVETKVKTAFTRAFNKESHKIPYAVQSTKKTRKVAVTTEGLGYGEDEESQASVVDEKEDEEELDGMIKAKKPAASKRKTASTSNTKRKDSSTSANKRKKKGASR